MKLQELIDNIQQWSIDRGLDKADSKKQMLKLFEEFGELAAGIAKGKPEVIKDSIGDCVVVLVILAQQEGVAPGEVFYTRYQWAGHEPMLKIGEHIGQLGYLVKAGYWHRFLSMEIEQITGGLEIIARQHDMTLEECLEAAWDEIRDRKGKMVDGVYIKQEDLK